MNWPQIIIFSLGMFFTVMGLCYNEKKHRKARKYGYTSGNILIGILKELPWYVTSIVLILFGLVLIMATIFIKFE